MFLPLRLRCSLDSETFLFFIGSGYDLWRGENSRELSQNPISKMIPFYVLYPELGTGERLLPQSNLTPKCNHIEALISLSRCRNVNKLSHAQLSLNKYYFYYNLLTSSWVKPKLAYILPQCLHFATVYINI